MRRIQPLEVWRLKGGINPTWRAALAAGHAPADLALWAVRAPAPCAAAIGAASFVATLRSSPAGTGGERRAGVCPLPDEEEAWLAVKGWLIARAVADGVRRVGGPRKKKYKGAPPDNDDAFRLAKIAVSLLRHALNNGLPADSGGWVRLTDLSAVIGQRTAISVDPNRAQFDAAIEASCGRLEVGAGADGEPLIRAILKDTRGPPNSRRWGCPLEASRGGWCMRPLSPS